MAILARKPPLLTPLTTMRPTAMCPILLKAIHSFRFNQKAHHNHLENFEKQFLGHSTRLKNHTVSIISHSKQHSEYHYPHFTDEEAKLRIIKQVTQGYPACNGSGFKPRAACLFPICHLLDSLSEKNNSQIHNQLSSQESNSFLYTQVSAPFARAQR